MGLDGFKGLKYSFLAYPSAGLVGEGVMTSELLAAVAVRGFGVIVAMVFEIEAREMFRKRWKRYLDPGRSRPFG